LETDNSELKVILDRAPVGIALLGTDRTVRYCNPAFSEIYGWSTEDLVGIRLPIPEHQQQKWRGLLGELREGRRFHDVETVRVRRDGTEFYARISGAPVFDQAGNLNALVGFVAVTQDNYSEQLELRNLEDLVQSASDFMCVVDFNLQTLLLNEQGRRLIGLDTNQDIDGTAIFDFFSEESRDDILTATRSLSSGSVSVSRGLHLKHVKTGAPIPVSCSIFLFRNPHTEEPVSYNFVARSSISERDNLPKPAQDTGAFDSLLQMVPVGVALINPAGYPINSNEAFRTMLGYTADEVIHIPFSRFVYPEDLAAGQALFRDLVEGKIERYETAKRLVDKNGNVIQTTMIVSLVRGPDGEPKHSISIVAPMAADVDSSGARLTQAANATSPRHCTQ
jgi:PAS domain S-box-containing protein